MDYEAALDLMTAVMRRARQDLDTKAYCDYPTRHPAKNCASNIIDGLSRHIDFLNQVGPDDVAEEVLRLAQREG